jgi:hypothetical protein
MRTRDLLIQIADLILVSDQDTADWFEVPKLRRIWYFFCGLIVVFALYSFGYTPLARYATLSQLVVFIYRVIGLSIYVLLASSILMLTVEYFKYVLSKNARIRLLNIFAFYGWSVLLFDLIYSELWLLWPALFDYVSPPVKQSFLAVTDT